MSSGFSLFFSSLFVVFHLNAQEKTITHRQQEWFQYYNQVKVAEKLFISSDAGFRIQNHPTAISTLLIRTSLSYSLKPGIFAGLGFACFTSYTKNKLVKSEFRPYEEFLVKHVFHSLNLQHRLRIEERAFRSELTNQNSFNFRFRYRLYLTYPVLTFHPEGKSLFIIASDEVFLNWGKGIVYNFEQNRIIGGIRFALNKNLQFSLSYVHQYAQKNPPVNYEETAVIWLGITHKIEKREKKD